MQDYKDVLRRFAYACIRRILVCDYDPELGGWLRLWMNLFEPDTKRWWGCQPSLMLAESEWSVRTGHITRALLWWEFTVRQQ